MAITVTTTDGTAIAMRLTDRSGKIEPIPVPVPPIGAGLIPNTSQIPFTAVNLYANRGGYKQIENENLQVFPETTTDQNLEMIPLSELTSDRGERQNFDTPAQNL